MKQRGTVVSMIVVSPIKLAMIVLALLLAAATASAQTYTVLHTYPIGSGAWSGIRAPQMMAQGRDGDLYSTLANTGTLFDGTVYKITPLNERHEVVEFQTKSSR